jgi:hypothetical protein
LYQVGATLSILAAMDTIRAALITGASSGIGAAWRRHWRDRADADAAVSFRTRRWNVTCSEPPFGPGLTRVNIMA